MPFGLVLIRVGRGDDSEPAGAKDENEDKDLECPLMREKTQLFIPGK